MSDLTFQTGGPGGGADINPGAGGGADVSNPGQQGENLGIGPNVDAPDHNADVTGPGGGDEVELPDEDSTGTR
jgi:hypothetical protein